VLNPETPETGDNEMPPRKRTDPTPPAPPVDPPAPTPTPEELQAAADAAAALIAPPEPTPDSGNPPEINVNVNVTLDPPPPTEPEPKRERRVPTTLAKVHLPATRAERGALATLAIRTAEDLGHAATSIQSTSEGFWVPEDVARVLYPSEFPEDAEVNGTGGSGSTGPSD
jgi:hypothetical protein